MTLGVYDDDDGDDNVVFACVQYQMLMEFIESLERLTLADKFDEVR